MMVFLVMGGLKMSFIVMVTSLNMEMGPVGLGIMTVVKAAVDSVLVEMDWLNVVLIVVGVVEFPMAVVVDTMESVLVMAIRFVMFLLVNVSPVVLWLVVVAVTVVILSFVSAPVVGVGPSLVLVRSLFI